MEIDECEIIQLELKYCECCGGLWLRRKGDLEIYCTNCLPYVSPGIPAKPRVKSPVPILMRIQVEGEDGEVLVCGKGGDA